MKFDFFADPGHGWVRVPMTLIEKLGIKDEISHFSYVRGDKVYLEEDGDLGTFIKAMKKINKRIEFREHHTDKSSRIRNYDMYPAKKKITPFETTKMDKVKITAIEGSKLLNNQTCKELMKVMSEGTSETLNKLQKSGISEQESIDTIKKIFDTTKEKDTIMLIGTAYFVNEAAAIKYYAKQEVDEESVEEYIKEGLIIIGKPEEKEGTKIVIDEQGRYWLNE
jgi:hypothetical protein